MTPWKLWAEVGAMLAATFSFGLSSYAWGNGYFFYCGLMFGMGVVNTINYVIMRWRG